MDKYNESTSYMEYKPSRNFQDSSKRDKVEEETEFDSGVMSGSYLSSSSSIMLSNSSIRSTVHEEEKETIQEIESNKETCSVMSLDSGLHMESSMDSGVNVSESFIKEETVAKERVETLELSEIQEGKIYIQDEDGDSPLHLSIIQGNHLLALRLIINMPFLINLPNKMNQTPLLIAVLTNSVKMVRLLVLEGAQVEYQDHNGNTALHLACQVRNHELVEALTKPESKTELHSLNPLTIDKPLYKFNSGIAGVRNFDGYTCLHIAALVENYRSLAYLCLEMSVDINIRDGKSGHTILHYFVQAQCLELLNFCLFRCKASPWIPNFARKTPLCLALTIRDYKPNDQTALNIVKILSKLGTPIVNESDDDYSSNEDSE